jgi:malic enzyme
MSEARAIAATGSPFPPVLREGKRHRIGQCNNAFVFPGVGLGLRIARARHVSDGMFLEAAKALAAQMRPEDIADCAAHPELSRIRDCSFAVACSTIRRAVEEGHAAPRFSNTSRRRSNGRCGSRIRRLALRLLPFVLVPDRVGTGPSVSLVSLRRSCCQPATRAGLVDWTRTGR